MQLWWLLWIGFLAFASSFEFSVHPVGITMQGRPSSNSANDAAVEYVSAISIVILHYF